MMGKKSANPTDRHVGVRIRMRRLMLGMSQGKLATAIGLTFQQVQKYEKGTNRVGASRLQQIGNILEVPPAFFFEGAPPGPSHKPGAKDESLPDYVTEFLSSADGLALMKGFTKVKDRKLRRCIVDLIDRITSARAA